MLDIGRFGLYQKCKEAGPKDCPHGEEKLALIGPKSLPSQGRKACPHRAEKLALIGEKLALKGEKLALIGP